MSWRQELSVIFLSWRDCPSGPRPPHYRGFIIILRHTTLRRTPLDEWSAQRTDLYLATHKTHRRQTYMPPAGLESTIPASERPQAHPLDRNLHFHSRFVICSAEGRLIIVVKQLIPGYPLRYITYITHAKNRIVNISYKTFYKFVLVLFSLSFCYIMNLKRRTFCNVCKL
jgi:hypothetical protein